MGSYKFRWEQPAEEVFVTGTFDDWQKTTKLDKVGSAFEKTVELPKTEDKILYKYVVDGQWKHDPTARTEPDHEGNTNNVIHQSDLTSSSLAGAAISSVGPGATTTEMAAEQPRSTPGAFPETPAATDDQTFSVNPIPASEGAGNPINLAPGEPVPDSSTITNNNITSGVHDDPELKSKDTAAGEQTFGVAPIPATGGIGNPIQLAPGEKVPDPSTITSNTVQSTATTDQASYEKSDASAPVSQPSAPTLQDQVSPAAGVFGNLGGPGPVIPESGMAMGDSKDITKEDTGPMTSSVGPDATTAGLAGQQPIEPRGEPTVIKDSREEGSSDPTISSVAPGSTTAGLAGQQPIEERGVPEVVSESQQEANADPEASANPAAVEEKKEVEEELQKKVPEAPSTSESGMLGKSENGIGAKVAGGVAAAGVATAGAAVAANEVIKEKTGTDPKSSLPQSVQDTMDEKAKDSSVPQQATESSTDAARDTTETVPSTVTESQKEAGEPAEASASPDVVKEKAEAEKELLSKVPESEAKGEPAPTDSAATATSAPAATSESGAPQLGDPTAGVAALSMDDKAPTPLDSRDVSPMSKKPTQQTEPLVTTGVATTSTPAKSEPQKTEAQKRNSLVNKLKAYKADESPESSAKKPATPGGASESKKKENRRSFFGRIKDKLKGGKGDPPSSSSNSSWRKSDDGAVGADLRETPKIPKIKRPPRAPGASSFSLLLEDLSPGKPRHDPPIQPPPPYLPPRRSTSPIDPSKLPPPFIPPPLTSARLTIPRNSEEAALLSQGYARVSSSAVAASPTAPPTTDQGTRGDSSASQSSDPEPFPDFEDRALRSSDSLPTPLTAPSTSDLRREFEEWLQKQDFEQD